ncbi:PRC-barrel domain-containing protein [Rhodobacteraceae bacterium 2376]|uniref:PRC-barrel domain-containing protein n=1 Tax=Rhabdonatronobacter sediminivivens TaxID=2743469 RepID=A0A7Z0I1I6_9RHOB|nr:PRC-barrel domain-containing protein [Rhabdonatronobacter sediminivivens]NYS26231.1 PRC-barrel domain-containing protein [Rhabdonatronobacter sediminivivens]
MTQHSNTRPGGGTGGAFGFVRDGYDRVGAHDLNTSDLESATVYGRNDENIGSISSLQLGSDDKITHAVVDVGGFLGIGAHSVLLPFEQLNVQRETGGSTVRVNLDTTKEKLKSLPHHAA